MSEYVKVSDVSKILDVSTARVYQMVQSGELRQVPVLLEGRGLKPTMVIPVEDVVRAALVRHGLKAGTQAADSFLSMVNCYAATTRVREFPPEHVQDAVLRYDAGESLKELSRTYDVSVGSMRRLLVENGREIRDADEALQQRVRAWLDDQNPNTVADIRRRYENGDGVPKIAEEIGWGRSGEKRVRRILEESGVQLRDRREAAMEAWNRRRFARVGAGSQ